MKVKYTDGTTVNPASFFDAMQSVKRNYPDAVVYQDGFFLDDEDEPMGEGRILIWANEGDSVNDDGGHAIAEIVDI